MTIYERIKFQTIILVYKCLNGMTPEYLQGLIEYAGLNHGYTLRTSGINLNVPKPRTELLRKSFCYAGPNTWNQLPMDIKSLVNCPFSVFKSSLRQYFKSINSV